MLDLPLIEVLAAASIRALGCFMYSRGEFNMENTPIPVQPQFLHPQVIAAILGAIIAGTFAFVVGWLTHRREKRRSDIQWFREKLLESYSNCIYYLVKLSISSSKKSTDDKDVRQHFSESQRYLILLRAYHSDNEHTSQLKECSRKLADTWNETDKLSDAADYAIEIVKSLLENDGRVQAAKEKKKKSKDTKSGEQVSGAPQADREE